MGIASLTRAASGGPIERYLAVAVPVPARGPVVEDALELVERAAVVGAVVLAAVVGGGRRGCADPVASLCCPCSCLCCDCGSSRGRKAAMLLSMREMPLSSTSMRSSWWPPPCPPELPQAFLPSRCCSADKDFWMIRGQSSVSIRLL